MNFLANTIYLIGVSDKVYFILVFFFFRKNFLCSFRMDFKIIVSGPAPLDCTVGAGNTGDSSGTLCIHQQQIYQELGLMRLDFLIGREIT